MSGKKPNINVGLGGTSNKPNPQISVSGLDNTLTRQKATGAGLDNSAGAKNTSSSRKGTLQKQNAINNLNPNNAYTTPSYNNNALSPHNNYTNNVNYNNYPQPRLVSPQSRMESDLATKLLQAIEFIGRNTPDLNEFFLEYDVYDGRIFEMYDLECIFGHRVMQHDFKRMCEDNNDKTALRNGTCEYKYLFNLIVVAPNCPHKFKDNIIKPQPQSIYTQKDATMLQGPLLLFVQNMLDMPAFASGRISEAYDEIFGKPSARDYEVNLDVMKKKAARHLSSGSVTPTDEVLTQFIDYVAYHPNKHCFTKAKFVAAVSHLVIYLNKAEIYKHFKVQMPGMPGYQTQNQHLLQSQATLGQQQLQHMNTFGNTLGQQQLQQMQMMGMNPAAGGMMPASMTPTSMTPAGMTPAGFSSAGMTPVGMMNQPVGAMGAAPQQQNAGVGAYGSARALISQAKLTLSQKQPGQISQQDVQSIFQMVSQAQTWVQGQMSPDPNYQTTLQQIQMVTTNFNMQTANQMDKYQQFIQSLTYVEQCLGILCQQSPSAQGMNPAGMGTGGMMMPTQSNSMTPGGMMPSTVSPPMPSGAAGGMMPASMTFATSTPTTQMNTLTPIVQDLISRICNTLNSQRKTIEEVFQGIVSDNIAGVKAYRSQDFISQLEREFHMVNTEASQIAQQFSVVGQPQSIDFMKFSSLIAQEQRKYEQIVMQFDMQLNMLQQAFRQRHTGVYKWFQTYMKKSYAENALDLDEFKQAIRALQCYQVTDHDAQQIFTMLDRQMRQKVPIEEIAGLFKEQARRQNPNIKPDDVCAKILKAFNCDIGFIDSELRKISQQKMNALPHEDAMYFFTKFPGFQAFYAENELSFMLDSYVRTSGKVELLDLIDAFQRVQRYNMANVQMNPGQSGIHQQPGQTNTAYQSQSQYGTAGGFANFSEDCTAAVAMAANLVRPAHMPNIDDVKIEDLQKACYVKGRTVKDYFSQHQFAIEASLTKPNFIDSLKQLTLKWSEFDMENVFNQICTMQQNGRFDKVEGEKIDQAVHFLCKKTLKQMHQEMLHQILMKSTQPGMQPIDMIFDQQIGRENYYQQSHVKTCSESQLTQILKICNIFWSEIDIKFLASQYLIQGQMIAYPKLLEDVKNAQKAESSGLAGVGDPKSICNAIQKQLHLLKFETGQYFQQHAGRDGKYTETEIVQLLGQRLQLCPEVCTESQLGGFWAQIDRNRQGSLAANVVAQFVQQQARPVLDLKIDIQKRLAEKPDFESRFTSNPVYVQTGGGQQFPIADFQNTLKQFYLPKIDCQFLTGFYEDHRKQFVNANQFVKDTINCRASGGLSNLPSGRRGDGSTNSGYDERLARQALALIAKEPLQTRTQLISQLSRAQRGQETWIEMRHFSTALPQHAPHVNQQMQKALEMKYTRSAGQFELKAFQDDLKQLVSALGDTGARLLVPDAETKRQFDSLAQLLEQGIAVERFVLHLKDMDRNGLGHLNEQMIISAFHDTYKDMNKTNVRLPTLTDDQIRGLLRFVNRNKNGFCSYRELLVQTFGPAKGEEYFLSEKSTLQDDLKQKSRAIQNRFIMPDQVQNPVDNIMGQIGTRMIGSGQNYEDVLRTAMGPNNPELKITRQQVFDMFNTIQVRPDNHEHNHMISIWWPRCQDGDGRVSVIQFLSDVGLRPQTISMQQVKKATGSELSQEKIIEAQKLMNMISLDLKNNQKVPAQVIEKHRKNKLDAGMRPKDFAMALRAECPSLKQKLTNDKLSILVNYLVKEELGMVSFQKLHTALNLRESDPPLRQDLLDQIREARGVIADQLQQAEIPIEVVHLLVFMQQNQLSLPDMFKVPAKVNPSIFIKDQEFEECCREKGYEPKDRTKLLQILTKRGATGQGISMHILSQFKQKWDSKQSPRDLAQAAGKPPGVPGLRPMKPGGRFDQDVLEKMNKISRWMQANNYSTKQMHDMLDTNNDDQVDKQEFVTGLSQLCIPGLATKDLIRVFDAIDIDNNRHLSVNEFSLYLEGAQQRIEDRINQLPDDIVREIEAEILQLFDIFDEDKNGRIDKYELIKTFQGLGYEMNEEKAMNMIKSVDANQTDIDKTGFIKLMKPEMQNRLLEQDDKIEEFRAMFKDADSDYSGYLTADEIYTVLLKNGIDLEYEELVELMNEFDASGDAQLDIDEFVAMMNTSSDIDFESDRAQATYLKIRKRSRLSVVDFMKALKNVPSAFVPSVFHQKWAKEGKVRPSDVLKAQLDPRTMTWKDMLPVLTEQLTPDMQQKANMPKIRPILSQYGSEITLESAEGIPLPPNTADFQREHVKKRAVRIGIFDTKKKEYFANAVQIEADWKQNAEDKWIFKKTDTSLNPVLFRSTKKDDLDLESMWFVFEFVIYYKKGNQNTELCCGWAHTDMTMAKRKQDKVRMDVQGGSPTTEILIQASDVHTKRTGLQGILKVFSSKIKSQLLVSFKPEAQLEVDTKFHMLFLPSTCLIQKKLLLFVSGYRNYAGQSLLKENTLGNFKKPGGSVAISCFPKIIDNIDILEQLVIVWQEDVIKQLSDTQKRSIQTPIQKTKEIIHKIYPVLFADEFKLYDSNHMESVVFDEARYKLRIAMLQSAMRMDATSKQAKAVKRKPLEEMTTFKPFNVRETQWEVWDLQQAKYEAYINMHQSRGKFGDANGLTRRSSRQPASARGMSAPQGFQQPRMPQYNNPMGAPGAQQMMQIQMQPQMQQQQMQGVGVPGAMPMGAGAMGAMGATPYQQQPNMMQQQPANNMMMAGLAAMPQNQLQQQQQFPPVNVGAL